MLDAKLKKFTFAGESKINIFICRLLQRLHLAAVKRLQVGARDQNRILTHAAAVASRQSTTGCGTRTPTLGCNNVQLAGMRHAASGKWQVGCRQLCFFSCNSFAVVNWSRSWGNIFIYLLAMLKATHFTCHLPPATWDAAQSGTDRRVTRVFN